MPGLKILPSIGELLPPGSLSTPFSRTTSHTRSATAAAAMSLRIYLSTRTLPVLGQSLRLDDSVAPSAISSNAGSRSIGHGQISAFCKKDNILTGSLKSSSIRSWGVVPSSHTSPHLLKNFLITFSPASCFARGARVHVHSA